MEPTNTPAPAVPESELKMPEEQFGARTAPAEPSRLLIPLLVTLLVLLLGVLGAFVLFGDQILGYLMPTSSTETPAPAETPAATTTPEATPVAETSTTTPSLDEIDAALTASDAQSFDSAINSIDTELSGTSTTSN
jgi:hypothetical protein